MILTLTAVTAAQVFTYIGYVIVALLALMVMIVVHELGHYTAGKLLGFKIDEFSIGFGPAIFKKKNKKNDETFSIRILPIGGFCAFHGEDADENKVDEEGKPILDEEGKPVKDNQAFNAQKPWKRLIVLFSGAFMNFLSAIFIITIYFAAYGQILPAVINTHNEAQVIAGARENQFQEGDVILAIDGKQVNILLQEDLDKAFAKLGDSAKFRVLRNGKRIKIETSKYWYSPFSDGDYVYSINGKQLETAVPYQDLDTVPEADTNEELTLVIVRYDDNGEIASSSGAKVQRGKVAEDPSGYYGYGFGITRTIQRAKLPFFLAFGRSFGFCFFVVFKILASLGALITGKLGLENAGGTITTITTIAKMSSLGFDSFLYVTAIISANLAVMNWLPFPALDGSRMLFTLIEMIFRKPVPRKVEAIIHMVGLILLVVLAVFLDIFHLVKA